MYGHSTTERKGENEKGMRARRDIDRSLKKKLSDEKKQEDSEQQVKAKGRPRKSLVDTPSSCRVRTSGLVAQYPLSMRKTLGSNLRVSISSMNMCILKPCTSRSRQKGGLENHY